jgi:glutathione-independent formaldehyde dehydrogenase
MGDPLDEGTVVGHEIMGVIEEVGEAVESIKKGDRVVLPFNIACGYCFNCHRGHPEACLTMNPEQPHEIILALVAGFPGNFRQLKSA